MANSAEAMAEAAAAAAAAAGRFLVGMEASSVQGEPAAVRA